MDINIRKLEQQFHADGYRLGMQAAEKGLSENELNEGVRVLYALVDQVIEAFTRYAELHQNAPDCKRGCSWCCHQPVFANSYELDALSTYVGRNFSEEAQTTLVEKASNKLTLTKNLAGEKLLNSKHPCPLLIDGACSVYDVRPVACRIYLSSNVNTCRQFYYDPANPDSVPALLDIPMRLGRMINEGFGAALKANGVKVQELRIEEGLANHKNTSP